MDHLHQVHGVDVSWTHRPTQAPREQQPHPSPGLSSDIRPPISSNGTNHAQKAGGQDQTSVSDVKISNMPVPAQVSTSASPPQASARAPAISTSSTNPVVPVISTTPASPTVATHPTTQATPAAEPTTPQKTPSRRPSILGRSSADSKGGGEKEKGARRNSWISNLSSKFSSQQPASPSAPQTNKSVANGINAAPPAQSAKDHLPASIKPKEKTDRETEELQPYIPQKPKDNNGSFFSNLTRRLSSNTQTGASCKNGNGGVCPRRVMNVDQYRERCLIPELDLAKLRRVSFSVDVEIACGPRYKDEPVVPKQQKTKERKVKDRAEGEALKHPEAVKEVSDTVDGSIDDAVVGSEVGATMANSQASETQSNDAGQTLDKKPMTDEERKERKEKKRRKAEEHGKLPVELTADAPSSPTVIPSSVVPTPPASGAATPKAQDRPTTDPVRIYRRCCQLRESPILKRITEQLMSPTCTMPDDPGVVAELRLSGSRMQLADVYTLSDWLAIVPVKRLLLEDADLNDEGVRVILAGLLAAKKPEPTKRRNGTRQSKAPSAGTIEKLTLKNNPRITKVGWKHISLFLYMCRSVKAVDVSMIQFPQSLPPTDGETEIKPPSGGMKTTGSNVDAAETLYKALSERLGGSQLEELTMAECGLSASQIRKIVDGATVSGISRLGFAGNNIDDEGFDHILHYVRSGVCHALDLGSNDLRDKLGRLAEALTSQPNCPVWGLSLAGCNLNTASLKQLMPSLIALQDLRFLDLSHNTDLFNGTSGAVQLLRKDLPKLQNLKRFHLRDVALSVKQTISLAEVLPEAASLAHLTLLENPQLEALANATDEQSQEEACALYASLGAAVRVSKSIVCIDIDVPSTDNGEVVKALAKQVVAYSLRNMDRTMSQTLTGPLAASLSAPHGVEDARYVPVPDVLFHLVGNIDGDPSVRDNHEIGPDEDYIVGGQGVIKALQYFLSEEAADLRRSSLTTSATSTPILNPKHAVKRNGKAKEVSKSLLESARKIRARLQPALVKEFTSGDEIQYRRLMFLDDTLKGIIERFETEYPETRIVDPTQLAPEATDAASLPSSLESSATFGPLSPTPGSLGDSSNTTPLTEVSPHSIHLVDEGINSRLGIPGSRKNSDVSLASRALGLEEGRIHRLGQSIRRDLFEQSTSMSTSALDDDDDDEKPLDPSVWAPGSRMDQMIKRMTDTSGPELQRILENSGWDGVMENLGANLQELKQLQMKDPVGWAQFKESQIKALANRRIGLVEGGGASASGAGDSTAVAGSSSNAI